MLIINRNPASPVLGLKRAAAFKLRSPIGNGGFADIYRETGRNQQPIAVKIDRSEIRTNGYSDVFIQKEAEALLRLEHPNIIKCFGYGKRLTSPGGLFLALEYIEGGMTPTEYAAKSPDKIAAFTFVLEGVASALAYLHDKGLVHADISNRNVLTNGRVVKLIDFSSLRPEGERVYPESDHWITGSIQYMSWPRFLKQPPMKRDDIYALGMVLFEILMLGDELLDSKGGLAADFNLFIRGEAAQEITEKFQSIENAIGGRIVTVPLPQSIKEILFKILGLRGRSQFADGRELLAAIPRKTELMPAWYRFKRPFMLDAGNIWEFIKFHSSFEGKYVFDRKNGSLALYGGEDMLHEQIALSEFKNADKPTMFGGYVSFEKNGRKIDFSLSGNSGHFGQPSTEDLKSASDYLAHLLKSIGLSPVAEFGPEFVEVKSK